MVTATGTGMAAIDHEFLGSQARLPGLLVEEFGTLDQLVPTGRGLHVDLDHTRVRRHLEIAQACVARRLVAFKQDRAIELLGRRLDNADQLQIIFQPLQWRHEQVQPAFSRFGTQGRAGQPIGGLIEFGNPLRLIGICLRLHGPRQCIPRRQVRQRLVRVGGMDIGVFGGTDPRLRGQRQAVAQR
ncbi:hypothetical protein D3C85_817730 [compost metagenome]